MSDGRILLFIILALFCVGVGRNIQRMVDAWNSWKSTVAKIPTLRAGAWAAVRTVIKVVLAALILLWAVVYINDITG